MATSRQRDPRIRDPRIRDPRIRDPRIKDRQQPRTPVDLNAASRLKTAPHRAPVNRRRGRRPRPFADSLALQWLKAGLVGALANFVAQAFTEMAITTRFAPFDISPLVAFFAFLGVGPWPLLYLAQLVYGALWAVAFVNFYGGSATLIRGLLLGFGLWVVLMVFYSPMMGWGVFGFGAPAGAAAQQPDSALRFMAVMLLVHSVYGAIVGGVTPRWISFQGVKLRLVPASPRR